MWLYGRSPLTFHARIVWSGVLDLKINFFGNYTYLFLLKIYIEIKITIGKTQFNLMDAQNEDIYIEYRRRKGHLITLGSSKKISWIEKKSTCLFIFQKCSKWSLGNFTKHEHFWRVSTNLNIISNKCKIQ